MVLVDTHGKLAFIGHPSSINIEASIEKLLKGEKLDAAAEEGEDNSGFKELDLAKVREEIGRYEAKANELTGNAYLSAAA